MHFFPPKESKPRSATCLCPIPEDAQKLNPAVSSWIPLCYLVGLIGLFFFTIWLLNVLEAPGFVHSLAAIIMMIALGVIQVASPPLIACPTCRCDLARSPLRFCPECGAPELLCDGRNAPICASCNSELSRGHVKGGWVRHYRVKYCSCCSQYVSEKGL